MSEPKKSPLAPDESQKDAIRSLLFRSISTEFTHPLNLIELNREYLEMHLEQNGKDYSPEKVRQSLEDIGDATRHLNRLMDNFLDLCACLQSAAKPVPETVDLCAVLQSVCADSADIYRALGITLTLSCGAESLYVCADPTYLERICLNLLSNSLRACSAGGHVTFTLHTGEQLHTLTVTDDGCGIPPELALNAFEPFKKLPASDRDRFLGGAGIGLYLCGEYCRLMGWKIALVPLPEGGTKATIRIPAQKSTASRVRFRSDGVEAQMLHEQLRASVLRELRCVPGLERLGEISSATL